MQQGNSSVNAVDKYGYTLLDWAVLGGSFEVMSFLVDKGSDINFQTAFFGIKPIHFAAVKGPRNIIEFFTSKGVSVDDLDGNNLTPLFYAVSAGNLDTVDYLLGKGANINAKDKNGRKLIYYASVYNNNKDIMELLLSKGLAVNETDKYGNTPIHYASYSGNLDMVKCLAENGANINAEDNYGSRPVNNAAGNGYLSILKYFIETKKVDINAKRNNGDTIMENVAYGCHLNLTKYMVEVVKANIEPRDKYQHTPLLATVLRSNHDGEKWITRCLEVIKYLVMKGANINARDYTGKNAIEMAHNDEVKKYLQQAAQGSRHRRDIFVNDYSRLQHEPFYIDFTDQTKLAASSGTRPSSLINDLFGWVKSSIGGLLSSALPKETSGTPSTISQIDAPMDVNGTIVLLDLLIRRFTGQKYISTVDQSISPLEAQGYALNIIEEFEKVVEQAGFKSCVSMYRLNIDFVEIQKEVTGKIMSGKFDEISGVLSSYLEKACPSREAGCPGKLSSKKFDKFMVEFNSGLLNQSIEQILHNGDGRLKVDDAKQMSLEPQSYLSNASVQGHSKVSTCLSDIGVTKLVNNLSR